MESNFELIVVFVNQGFSDVVMDAAREQGARGGTIVHARGTGTKDMEKRFGIIITPNKEMIMILVNKEIKESVMNAIYKVAGLANDGQGIVFSLPVSEVAGLKYDG